MKRAIFVALALSCALKVAVHGQQLNSGKNVNVVGGPATVDASGVPVMGDPYLQRQNEPSMACSVRNPLNCLLGANDYRTVNFPDPAGGKVTGDAWLGVFWTRDGGQSWRSQPLPGFPQDTSPLADSVPMRGFQAAADPTVRPGSNGLLYYSGIAFNRSAISGNSSGAEGKEGVLFVATYIDDNNTQQIDTPFRLVRVSPIVYSTPDKFTDKPWMAVDIPRAGSASCTIPAGDGVPAQTFPAGNVYVAYTVFQGDGDAIHSKLMFVRSTDCGQTWGHPLKLSESFKINQSATIAIHPDTGQVLVAWREFNTTSNKDGIVVARSDDFGKTFPKAVRVAELTLPDTTSAGVDQPSLPSIDVPEFRMFRTNSYPSMCVASNGTVYLAWAQRNVHVSGDARILYSTTTTGDTWSTPVPIDNPGAAENRGHQAMPALSCAGNKVTAIWYDQREDALGWLAPNGAGWGRYMADPIPPPPSRTIDVRAAEAVAGAPFGPSIRVSRYQYGIYDAGTGPQALQVEYNLENLPLFAGGRVPFLGDYIDIAPAPAMLPAGAGGAMSGTSTSGLTFKNKNRANKAAELGAPNGWVFNTSPSAAPVFHAVWTDNRDVRTPAGTTTFEAPNCSPGTQAGTKNQNIYTSRLTPGAVAGALGNARPYGPLDRAFPVYVQNTSAVQKSFTLTIATQLPQGVVASFSQFAVPDATPAIPYPLLTLQVNLPPHSAAARSVFVHTTTATTALLPIRVDVDEVVPAGTVGIQTSIVLNPDPTNPAPADAGVAQGFEEHLPLLTADQIVEYLNPNFLNPNFLNPNFFNPNFINPNFFNPNFLNPNFINPNFINPNFLNPNFINPNFLNPNFFNPNFLNPNFLNPNFINPNFLNPNFINQPVVTELNWTVEAAGNTASSFLFRYLTANPLPPEWTVQLLIYRLYHMPGPGADDPCALGEVTVQEKVVDVFNPNFLNPNFLNPNFINFANPNFLNSALDPAASNATFALGDADEAKITLRIMHNGTFEPESVSAVVIAGAVDSVDAANNVTTPEFVPTLTVTTTGLPQATVGQAYTTQLLAVGGSGTYTWSGAPPAGLQVTPQGLVTGTAPTTEGLYSFEVQVTDGARTASSTVTLRVNDPFVITFETLPDGTPTCAFCVITDQFATRGVVFSFAPNVPAEAGVRLVDSTAVDPAGESQNHSIRNPEATGGGQATGTFIMTLLNSPTLTTFRLRAPTSGFSVAAFDTQGNALPAEQITQTGAPYTPSSACCGQYYEASVSVTHAGGIGRIEVNSGGQNVFLDNVRLSGQLLLVDFGNSAGSGDFIDRGFYHPYYPGSTLDEVQLWLTTNTAGTYTVSMTAREGSYDGTMVGTATATASLTPDVSTPVRFIFSSAVTTPGSVLTFSMTQVSPAGLGVYYAMEAPQCGLADPNCITFNPTIETEGTTPPLDTFRRKAVAVRIYGQPGPAVVVGPVGGTGGSAFGPVSCPAGSVGTSLRGLSGDDIDQTNLWCSPVSGTILGQPSLAGGVGGVSGAPYTLSCPAGSALTGVHGLAGVVIADIDIIDTLGVRCTNLDTGAQFTSGTAGLASAGTSPFALDCPAGMTIVGIQGQQGALLDQIAIRCQVPR